LPLTRAGSRATWSSQQSRRGSASSSGLAKGRSFCFRLGSHTPHRGPMLGLSAICEALVMIFNHDYRHGRFSHVARRSFEYSRSVASSNTADRERVPCRACDCRNFSKYGLCPGACSLCSHVHADTIPAIPHSTPFPSVQHHLPPCNTVYPVKRHLPHMQHRELGRSLGLVVERTRAPTELDGLRWYVLCKCSF
jgi:hypothetical protein